MRLWKPYAVAVLFVGIASAACAQDMSEWSVSKSRHHAGRPDSCDIVQRSYTYVNCCGELVASPDDPRSAPGGAQ